MRLSIAGIDLRDGFTSQSFPPNYPVENNYQSSEHLFEDNNQV